MISLVVAGTSAFGLPSFDTLLHHDAIKVVGVITQPARPVGRRQVMATTAVAAWAERHHVSILTPSSWHDPSALRQLRTWQPDIMLVAAYGLIVPATVLAIPKKGSLNIHASLLPAYRGASPIAAAILNGDTETGITFMVMDVGMDTGPIVDQFTCPILPADTTPTLSDRLANLAADHAIPIITSYLAGTSIPKAQGPGATLAKKITRANGRMTWESARRLERQVRAYTPWPGLWTTWHAKTFKILSGFFLPHSRPEPPGTIVQHQDGWAVVCADGLFLPRQVQFEGKQVQPADRIPGSYPGFLGGRLGS